jgi:hypothetical protein
LFLGHFFGFRTQKGSGFSKEVDYSGAPRSDNSRLLAFSFTKATIFGLFLLANSLCSPRVHGFFGSPTVVQRKFSSKITPILPAIFNSHLLIVFLLLRSTSLSSGTEKSWIFLSQFVLKLSLYLCFS